VEVDCFIRRLKESRGAESGSRELTGPPTESMMRTGALGFYFLACRTGTVSVLLASSLPRSLARARP
jgi:hypothetical protein